MAQRHRHRNGAGRIIPATLVLALLAACQMAKPRVDAPPANPIPIPIAAAAPTPLPAARALTLLDAVCGASLPNFGTIDATLRANGITVASEATTMRSPTEDVSFRLQDGPGDGKTCAMVFGATDDAATIRAAFASLGAFKETPLGTATKYRGRAAIFIYDGPAQQIGGVQYYTVRLLSER